MLARTELDQEAKILSDAADLVEKSWYHLHSQCDQGANCIMTAIHQAGYGHRVHLSGLHLVWNDKPAFDAPSRAADRVTRYLGLTRRSDAVLWNDARARTKEQVVDALRNAAYYRE